jgi:molybdopterin converting factor subunit 1
MISISVRYFAALREQSGKSEEALDTPARTAGELYADLRGRYGFALAAHQVKVAVNQEYRSLDHVLAAGDEVVFIPPVSGG